MTLDEAKTKFPVGAKIRFSPGRGAPEVSGTVAKVRTSGVAGSKGFSVFIDTVEKLADGKTKERSVRPGVVTLAA